MLVFHYTYSSKKAAGFTISFSKFRMGRTFILALLTGCFFLLQNQLYAQDSEGLTASILKEMSMEELMNIEVTSVSKRPERLAEVASGIQIITNEEIRRSGASNIPEALKLASNLQVAQVNSSQWAISSRGFNNVLSNKLLVMIDGRSVYTPLYAGVFWDVQNLLLEDVDRIEVISGPGGTMWGSNAVNGVINIITKHSKNSQGLFVEAAAGNMLQGLGSIRYGGKIGEDFHFRVYGTGYKRNETELFDGNDAADDWHMLQGGFRADYKASPNNTLTLQSDVYYGQPNPDGLEHVSAQGDNVLARWTHTFSEESNFQIQAYYDHTWRDFNNGLKENLQTYDLDAQHSFAPGERHKIVWGLGIRLMDHQMHNLESFAFLPANKTMRLYSAFIQDEFALLKDELFLTVGSKFEHNTFTGFEFQPNGRITWNPKTNQAIWASVSRAVRIPSRIDSDFHIFLAPDVPLIAAGDFESAELLAYELGWRLRASDNVSFSLASYYNIYDNLRTAEPGDPLPITYGNGLEGKTFGLELASTFQVSDWWQVKSGYTFLEKDLKVKPSSADLNGGSAESNDPAHQVLVQSNMDLTGGLELGAVARYVSTLPAPEVSEYFGLDIRVGWKVDDFWELSLVGQNLLDDQHTEFIPESPSPRKIPRSFYGKVIYRL